MTAFNYSLKISDGTTTVTLTATPFAIRTPDLTSANRNEQKTSHTLEIRLKDGTPQANIGEVSDLNALLFNAYLRNKAYRREIAPVYLLWKDSPTGTEWRSEILDGYCDLEEKARTLPFWTNNTQFANLFIERVNHWDGPVTTLIAEATIDNDEDNYVDLDGDDISGDMPGPVRLELTNTYNAENRHAQVYVGVSQLNIDGFPSVLAGDSVESVPQGTEMTVATWTLTSIQMTAASGRPFKFIAARSAPSTGTMFRLRVVFAVTELFTSGWVVPHPNVEIWELGAVPIPPWLPGLEDLTSVDLELRIYNPIGALGSGYTLTAMYALPTDQYRALIPIGYNLPYTYRLIVDDIEGNVYIDDGADGDKLGNYNAQAGQPLTVKPGIDQRFVFLVTQDTNVADVSARTSEVTIKYRPRRLSV